MKLTDLSIGNYVEHKKDGIIKVTAIVDDSKGLVRCDQGNWLYAKDLSPIKLSKKWVKTLRFKNVSDIAEWELYIHGVVEQITIGVDFDKKGKNVFSVCVHDDQTNNMVNPEIMYVHELQNLILTISYQSSILNGEGVVW
jgi:hypothetical protein